MLSADYIVVGPGLSGATIARCLADAGREVIVLERRSHVGGNVHDFQHESGIRIHTYGPHYFRTGSQRIWDFVTRFAEFYRYEPHLLSLVDGQYEHWPVIRAYMDRVVGSNWSPAFTGHPTNFEEACLSQMPAVIYQKFVKGYTEKQWGAPAHTLSANLAGRFDVRLDNDTRLCRHQFQGLPRGGYLQWTTALLANIPVFCETDYITRKTEFRHKRYLVFTGSLDELLGCSLGKLKYRCQRRRHVYFPDKSQILPCGQVNNPDPTNGPHVRMLEWKHMMDGDSARVTVGTVVTSETPSAATDHDSCEYPFPDETSAQIYREYARMVAKMDDVVICGRLAEYRYYDMDQAIGRAMTVAKKLLAN